jgi:hypothetical protein
MGCGIAVRGPQVPLYTNEFSPPCHELVPLHSAFPENFPPSGIIQSDRGFFFDDREFIKQCQIIHINEITVYMERFITGIEIIYFLDGAMRVVKHVGSIQGNKFVLPLQTNDSIVMCEATHEESKLRSLRLESLEGRVMDLVSLEGHGSQKTTLNLKSQRRAVVAFKGKIDEYVEGLRVYSWRMVGKISG